MNDRLLDRFPEIGEITDADMRNKTVACVLEALTLGGWQVDDLDRVPFTLMIPNNPVSLLAHLRATVQSALKIADTLEQFFSPYYRIDRDILRCGAILHDIGKLMEFMETEKRFAYSSAGRLLSHPVTGAALAMKHGLPLEVVHIVAYHTGEDAARYRTPAAIVVHHSSQIVYEPLKDLLNIA
ncbi:HD domain-containing protein [candidate division KSB1 bacterium]|nr:HD domain-containing protein [candidate division KSB1 bacterium]